MLNFNSEEFPIVDQDVQFAKTFRDLPDALPEVRGLKEKTKMEAYKFNLGSKT